MSPTERIAAIRILADDPVWRVNEGEAVLRWFADTAERYREALDDVLGFATAHKYPSIPPAQAERIRRIARDALEAAAKGGDAP